MEADPIDQILAYTAFNKATNRYKTRKRAKQKPNITVGDRSLKQNRRGFFPLDH